MPLPSSTSITRAFVALAAVALAACGDPVGPVASPARPSLDRGAVAAPEIAVVALKRLKPLDGALTASAVIDRRGGELQIRKAGITVKVPSGAVSAPTRFTVTALAGDLVAYEFEPHGIQFARPLEAAQELRVTTLGNNGHNSTEVALSELRAAYFPTTQSLDFDRGVARVLEFEPTTIDLHGHEVRWEIRHFSGYMVSSGRYATSGVQE